MNRDSVARLIPSLRQLGTKTVLLSGGEPLLNPEWREIAELLRAAGMQLWLLTSGLSLAKHALKVRELFDTVTVSLDGTNPETYLAIRGLDAFDNVTEGIRLASKLGSTVLIRVTLQRRNFRELPQFVEAAKRNGAHQVSFLAADVANPHAFGRQDDFNRDVGLTADELPLFESLLEEMELRFAPDFASRFIAESPQKLRRLLFYFAAVCGQGSYPPVKCNAPEFSAVIEADGRVKPCFFIPGANDAIVRDDLSQALNTQAMMTLRGHIRAGLRAECSTCVCSMWRDPESDLLSQFEQRRPA